VTADEIRELFRYNAWAHRRMFDALAALPAEQYHRDVKCSFASIHGTVAHIVWAEHLWLSRWLGAPPPPPATAQGKDLPSLADARARWDEVEAQRGTFLESLTDAGLHDTLTIQPTTGGAYVHTLQQTLQHAVDHSSYHRGQIVTMLRQLGVKPPSTGLIGFYREQGQ